MNFNELDKVAGGTGPLNATGPLGETGPLGLKIYLKNRVQ